VIARHWTPGLTCAGLLLNAAATLAADGGKSPQVAELLATIADDRSTATVDFRVDGGVSENALERIHSGISVSLKYRLRMMADRDFPLLPWDEIARTRILATVTYDSLTGVYSLTRTFDFKARRKRDNPTPIVQTRETSSVDEMRSWMTEFEAVSLYDPANPFAERRFRVKLDSDLGRRYVWYVFPGTIGATAELDLAE
jgi:hypothetical protein